MKQKQSFGLLDAHQTSKDVYQKTYNTMLRRYGFFGNHLIRVRSYRPIDDVFLALTNRVKNKIKNKITT